MPVEKPADQPQAAPKLVKEAVLKEVDRGTTEAAANVEAEAVDDSVAEPT